EKEQEGKKSQKRAERKTGKKVLNNSIPKLDHRYLVNVLAGNGNISIGLGLAGQDINDHKVVKIMLEAYSARNEKRFDMQKKIERDSEDESHEEIGNIALFQYNKERRKGSSEEDEKLLQKYLFKLEKELNAHASHDKHESFQPVEDGEVSTKKSPVIVLSKIGLSSSTQGVGSCTMTPCSKHLSTKNIPKLSNKKQYTKHRNMDQNSPKTILNVHRGTILNLSFIFKTKSNELRILHEKYSIEHFGLVWVHLLEKYILLKSICGIRVQI
ncbi:hypothetical protein ACJX0J_008751, partial [Zea mays]